MIKLKILKIEDDVFKIEDEEKNIYKFHLKFIDTDIKLDVGDIIYFDSKLLNPKYEEYSLAYIFSNLDSQYGRKNVDLKSAEIIKIIKAGKEIYLKRIYG